ncbi:MAG: hypothetical protein AB8B53_14780 [Flavobacteriales bacterium]
MKNLLLLAALCVVMASCKKDYVCSCVLDGETAVDNTLPINDSSKDDAEAACEAWETAGETCTLD